MTRRKKTEKATALTNRGFAKFRPRARIIQTLGRDLISNEFIAIQELIKNAYDADATTVTITFEEPLLPGKGAVIIGDNGDGMTFDVVRTAWMEPATVSKIRTKNSRKGRRVTGEKGIGRFAAARVARVLEMETIPRGTKEQIRVRFDWGAFEDQARYLDEVRCSWEMQPAPVKARHGTELKLLGLNDEWDEDKKRGMTSFSDLRGELSRLVAPLQKDEFVIELKLPERLNSYAGRITPPEVLGKPQYKLHGSLTDEGKMIASYEGPDRKEKLVDDGKEPVILLQGGRPPRCGPFEFELRVWDRQTEDLEPLAKQLGSSVRDIRRDLDAAGGISVYRDNFRVLIPESDWLRLDLRRVQNPTLRLSNNQVVGRVLISADRNPGLKDQTNRQGIVDSAQLEDFKASLKEILSRLEVKRDNYRRSTRPAAPSTGIFEKLQIAPVKAFLIRRYPEDTELRAYLEQTTHTFEQGVGEVQQVLARYRRLATLGQLIDVVLHEGRTPVATIKNEIQLANGDLGKKGNVDISERLEKRFKVITDQADVLALLFKRLAPFSGRKRGRPIRITVEQLIKDSFELYQKQLDSLKITTELPKGETWVTADPSEMQMIFVNLLDNSLYWLEKVGESKRQIAVEVHPEIGELRIIFSDSGPGVSEDVRDRIFDPYFSTKSEGVGLGLTIAGETAAEYDGSLELLAKGPLSGATFRITLRKRLGITDAE